MDKCEGFGYMLYWTPHSRTLFTPDFSRKRFVCISVADIWKGEEGEGYKAPQSHRLGADAVLLSVSVCLSGPGYFVHFTTKFSLNL